MPNFVILEHDHPELHWDFMLENGPVLRTWRLAKAPGKEGEQIQAIPLADHRLAYLDYEGEVSGGRGKVMRWDKGSYEATVSRPDIVEISLQGFRLVGNVVLKQEKDHDWLFTFLGANQNP